MSEHRPAPGDVIVGEQYYILASEVAADLPKLVLKHDEAFVVANRRGDLPGLAGSGLTATQRAAQLYGATCPDCTGALQRIDQLCNPSCSIYGPYAMFSPQFSALSAWSSLGRGNYHSMQWTVRKRMSADLTFDFNFTYSKSMDLVSSSESGGSFSGPTTISGGVGSNVTAVTEASALPCLPLAVPLRASSGSTILMATWRCSSASSARKTAPMPPRPSVLRTR